MIKLGQVSPHHKKLFAEQGTHKWLTPEFQNCLRNGTRR